MMPIIRTYFLIQMMLFVGVTTGFLFDDNSCTTGNNCTCNNEIISCYSKGLIDVPLFNITGTYISIRTLDFGYNAINTLRNGRFSFLRNLTTTSMEVNFNSNNLSSMEDMCFEELKTAIVYLRLGYNNLKTIPMAISSLTNLRTLDLGFNPIIQFDPSVLFSIGDTLEKLVLSLTKVNRWPEELHFLYNLQDLEINHFSAKTITASDFQYMTQIKSLNTLVIQNTDLKEFPAAFCDLSSVQTLNLDYNNFTGRGNDMFSTCHRPLSNISTLSLHTNQLEYFPDLGTAFSATKSLNLQNNNIRYISNELTAMPFLENLYLDNNKLCHIPSTLASIAPNLRYLYLTNNFIDEIDNQALGALSNLWYLYLLGNPLEYVAEHAFSHNPALTFIIVVSTKLSTIPCALSITSHQQIYYYPDRIECDCRMKCLKNITLSNLKLNGQSCLQTNITIEHFINNVIKADKCG
ncbi:leucine-rich repeats and immunoglobulin-like domains protein 1 [Dreissena polymorpha]|uniref:Uncharacterized protein n=1 Tax=Dreissena polymorpha TaxID=45954 RepID=A0A9D3YCP4_DREPO|nr:leucine-rich repeats and immunoglobulin-like domains protein 1 [Dreissena polymorpha]KAH3696721.1 hypothetical protein DPMN_084197 [Dreissena polymorpha]